MSTAQEIGLKVQEQALETVRMTQDAVIEAVTAWSETASKLAAQLPDFATDYKAPEFADLIKQFPTAADVIDSNFDFAQRILANQREFVQRIVAATPAHLKPLGG